MIALPTTCPARKSSEPKKHYAFDDGAGNTADKSSLHEPLLMVRREYEEVGEDYVPLWTRK
jgi:hypothetical protein